MTLANINEIRLGYSNNSTLILQEKDCKLIRLQEEHIEMVRNWRNSPEVSKYMLTQDYITEENQKKWFAKVSVEKNSFYFVIYHKEKAIGLISMYSIDYEKGEYISGAYIADADYLNTAYSYNAVLLCANFAFNLLELAQCRIQIKNDNERAIRFNTFLGFKKVGKYDENNDEYILLKDTFLSQNTHKNI